MRCRICGAKLAKEGDICSNCYKLYQKEEDLKKDVNERLVVKRKYSIKYNLLKYMLYIIIFILSIIVCLSSAQFLAALGLTVLGIFVIGLLLFIDKRIARGTKATFYDRKVVYEFHFWFIDNEKVVTYDNITEALIYKPTLRQRRFDLGDICVYAKGAIPGSTLLNGFQIKNVENPEEVLEKISEVINS